MASSLKTLYEIQHRAPPIVISNLVGTASDELANVHQEIHEQKCQLMYVIFSQGRGSRKILCEKQHLSMPSLAGMFKLARLHFNCALRIARSSCCDYLIASLLLICFCSESLRSLSFFSSEFLVSNAAACSLEFPGSVLHYPPCC